jgi:hypothetical protein
VAMAFSAMQRAQATSNAAAARPTRCPAKKGTSCTCEADCGASLAKGLAGHKRHVAGMRVCSNCYTAIDSSR